MTRMMLILMAGLALNGCARAPRDVFATPPSADRPAAATDYGVDIPTRDEPEPSDPKPPAP